jgi:hypothetical protein
VLQNVVVGVTEGEYFSDFSTKQNENKATPAVAASNGTAIQSQAVQITLAGITKLDALYIRPFFVRRFTQKVFLVLTQCCNFVVDFLGKEGKYDALNQHGNAMVSRSGAGD